MKIAPAVAPRYSARKRSALAPSRSIARSPASACPRLQPFLAANGQPVADEQHADDAQRPGGEHAQRAVDPRDAGVDAAARQHEAGDGQHRRD